MTDQLNAAASGRTPKDYAIEHAKYIAKGAEQLMAAVRAYLDTRKQQSYSERYKAILAVAPIKQGAGS